LTRNVRRRRDGPAASGDYRGVLTYDDAEAFSGGVLRCAGLDGHDRPDWEEAAEAWVWQREPERRGILVYDLPASPLPSGWTWVRIGAEPRKPAIMIRGLTGRERDHNGGHELGHIVLAVLDLRLAPDVHEERWCNRFASSLLAPADVVRRAWRRARANGERVGQHVKALRPTALALRLGEVGVASVLVTQRERVIYTAGPGLIPANDVRPLVRLALRAGRADGDGLRAYRLSDGVDRVAVLRAA